MKLFRSKTNTKEQVMSNEIAGDQSLEELLVYQEELVGRITPQLRNLEYKLRQVMAPIVADDDLVEDGGDVGLLGRDLRTIVQNNNNDLIVLSSTIDGIISRLRISREDRGFNE